MWWEGGGLRGCLGVWLELECDWMVLMYVGVVWVRKLDWLGKLMFDAVVGRVVGLGVVAGRVVGGGGVVGLGVVAGMRVGRREG